MSTASSPIQPPTILARAAFVDLTTGMLTKEAFWFLYQLFKAAFAAESSSTILDFIDSASDIAPSLSPRVEDLERLFALEESTQGGSSQSGAAGGDLYGTYPNPQVAGLRGSPISITPPTIGQVLGFLGAAWGPVTPSVTPGAIIIQDLGTLSVPTTNVVASVLPAPANGCLAVKAQQDVTGGRLLTWDAASFLYAPPGPGYLKGNARLTEFFTADVASGLWEPGTPMAVHL